MAELLALLAALCFALGSTLQQRGTLETAAGEGDPRFLAQILRRPVWLAGAASQTAGWVLQAAALDRGALVVVQSLTTLSLVIALPLGVRFTAQRIDRRVVLGATATVAGIVCFLSIGSPQGGVAQPSATAWWTAGVTIALAVVVLAGLGRHHRGAARALLFGSAAGCCYALQASVTKVFVTLLGHGLATLATSWTAYVLAASALIGFALQQSALKTGVLAPAMGSSNAVTLFASVLIGTTVFEESLAAGTASRVPAAIGLGVAMAGIALLAGAPPPDAAAGGVRVDGAAASGDTAT